MRRNRSVPRGQVHRVSLNSGVLKGNLQGDPTQREMDIYTPAGYDGSARLPLLVDALDLQGPVCSTPPGVPSRRTYPSDWTG
ncbi:hypothetical protein MAUB1S_07579 [Mycolicibacterium aubagnense]